MTPVRTDSQNELAETRVFIGVDQQNEGGRNQFRHQKFLLSEKHRQTQLFHTQMAHTDH